MNAATVAGRRRAGHGGSSPAQLACSAKAHPSTFRADHFPTDHADDRARAHSSTPAAMSHREEVNVEHARRSEHERHRPRPATQEFTHEDGPWTSPVTGAALSAESVPSNTQVAPYPSARDHHKTKTKSNGEDQDQATDRDRADLWESPPKKADLALIQPTPSSLPSAEEQAVRQPAAGVRTTKTGGDPRRFGGQEVNHRGRRSFWSRG